MFNLKKTAAVLSAVSVMGTYAFIIPAASAAEASIAPVAEMGVRIAAETAAGNINPDSTNNLGSGIAKGSTEDGWTAVETVGEGTDGRMQARYDMDETETMELAYGQSKRFALLEQYSVDNLQAAESITFNYVSANASGQKIGIWLYNYDMPTSCTVNTTGAETANTIIQNLAKTYGIYSGNSTATDATVTTATAAEPLAVSAEKGTADGAYTITVTGDALDTVKNAATYADGVGTFTITVNNTNLYGNTTAKIYMAASADNAPKLTVTYAAQETTDAPEGAIVLKDAVTNSTSALAKFSIDDSSYINAVTTTANNDIWYLGDYDLEDVTGINVKAVMCPGTSGDETVIPAIKLAYGDIGEETGVDADYITENSSTIRSGANKLGEYSGTTTEETKSESYSDFQDITIENTAEKTGTKHLFIYGTASKARVYMDYVKVNGSSLAAYPDGATGVYGTDVVTNYSGNFTKAALSDTTYRYVTDYKNNNGNIWYLGTYSKKLIESIDISAALTAVTGSDGNSYAPSVKLGYMPASETAVDTAYLTDNSKTIRAASNMLYEWKEATDGVSVKNVTADELKTIDDDNIELFVYGTTQVKYTYTDADGAEQTANAQPVLGLDYVKVNLADPSGLTIIASDDMQLRTGNTNDYRTTSSFELKANDAERYAFTGAVKFDISAVTSYINNGYKVKSAKLRLTTMKRNNSNSIAAVPFTTDFGEEYAKEDVLGDELIDTVKYAVSNYTSYDMGSVNYAMTGKKLNEYAAAENADSDLSKWYTTVDISAYLGGAAAGGAAELPLVLYNTNENDKTGNIICTKDMEKDMNWETIAGFYTIDGNAVTAADFAPTLIVELEEGTETAEPITVLTDRIYTNRVVIGGGYDYLAWSCDKDVTDNGKTVTAGSPLYSVKRVIEDEANAELGLTADDFTLGTYYITEGTVLENGAANTRTNPYVDADGTVYRESVNEYVNTITLSDDLVSAGNKVYAAVYNEDGTLDTISVYDAAAEIQIELDENGEGIKVAPGETLKVFVWDGSQNAVYVN